VREILNLNGDLSKLTAPSRIGVILGPALLHLAP